jgi:hypothetical protein
VIDYDAQAVGGTGGPGPRDAHAAAVTGRRHLRWATLPSLVVVAAVLLAGWLVPSPAHAQPAPVPLAGDYRWWSCCDIAIHVQGSIATFTKDSGALTCLEDRTGKVAYSGLPATAVPGGDPFPVTEHIQCGSGMGTTVATTLRLDADGNFLWTENNLGWQRDSVAKEGCRTVTATRANRDWSAFPEHVHDDLTNWGFSPSKPLDTSSLQVTFCWDGTTVKNHTQIGNHQLDPAFVLAGARTKKAKMTVQDDAATPRRWVLVEYEGEVEGQMYGWTPPAQIPGLPVQEIPWEGQVSIRVHADGHYECSPEATTTGYIAKCEGGPVQAG